MNISDFFFKLLLNRAGRIRSGWRFALFTVGFLCVLYALGSGLIFALSHTLSEANRHTVLDSNFGFIVQSLLLLAPSVLMGWLCNRALENLPWRALGWTFHHRWARDLVIGLLLGAAFIATATIIAVSAGGLRFTLAPAAMWPAVGRTLLFSSIIFLCGAAAEESVFRGYALQTLMRSWPLWLALLPTSVPFALVHLLNPNVSRGFTMANTVLAGVWLAVAYSRTRSLWFPLGLHLSWNWTMGALLGIPVSGITRITPETLLHSTDAGPAWLTGGSYGLEGGAACTLALVLAILFIWRTRLVSADADLKKLTDGENTNVADVSTAL